MLAQEIKVVAEAEVETPEVKLDEQQAPVELTGEWLRLVGGGTLEDGSPTKGW